jgi:hypothetical protein
MTRRKATLQRDPLAEQTGYEQEHQQDALRYIAEMAGELASLAGAERMPMLTYFLNMARVEAEMGINDSVGPERETSQSKSAARRRANA